MSSVSINLAVAPNSVQGTVGRTAAPAAWVAVVISLSAVVPVTYTGSLGAAVFLMIWILFAIAFLRSSLVALRAHWSIWVFPAFALLSTLWSETHLMTLRHSLELMATVGCAAVAARHLAPRQLLMALSCAFFIISVLSIVIGRYIMNPPEFVGVFESKNQLALFVSLVLITNFSLLIDRSFGWMIRIWSAVCIVVGFLLFEIMDRTSTTAVIMSVLGPAILFANYALANAKRPTRRLVLCLALVLGAIALAAIAMAGDTVLDLVLTGLGKDSTLTGRTVLWARALHVIPEHPLLGQGFEAFWRENYVEAESIWQLYNYGESYGFHFHNTYIETAVGLGFVGCAILVYFMIATTIRVVRWSWDDRSIVSSFYVTLMANLLLRSFFEVDVTYQFYYGATLFYAMMYFGYEYAPLRRRPPAAAPRGLSPTRPAIGGRRSLAGRG